MAVNKVLLFTVQNALYPITCDVLHAICHPCGNVLRIVMVRKRGVQALVEFDTVEAAKKAKESLNFADIYAGCCTLKIEFSRMFAFSFDRICFGDSVRKFDWPGAARSRCPSLTRRGMRTGVI